MEALACGKAVISTDCDADPREILAPETNLLSKTRKIEYAHYVVWVPVKSNDVFDRNVIAPSPEIEGSIVYTKVGIRDGGVIRDAISFGPVSVLPALWGQGIGSALIYRCHSHGKEKGCRAILLHGDPDQYQRFGFIPAETFGIGSADNMYMDAL
jgi:GNAT superfamily N-acetyltransferase